MAEYKERKYRKSFATENRIAFIVEYKKSDLWIAVDRPSWNEDIPKFCSGRLAALWRGMEHWLAHNPAYAKSLVAYPASPDAPEIFLRMSDAALRAGTGPMSAVAGAVAEYIAEEIRAEFGCGEVIVENGGDIFARFTAPMDVSVFAGASPLSGKVGFHIPAEYSPLGICTSSGTVGPSLSFGRADAVMIISRDTPAADSYATAFGNMVKEQEDIERVIEEISSREDILAAIIIKDDRMGITGELDMKLFG